MPVTLKVILILAIIIVLIRFKIPLSLTLLGSAVGLGLLFQLPYADLVRSMLKGATDLETLKLIAALLLILFFSAIMKETGNMSRAISALRAVFRDARVTVAMIPGIIGLVPIMGGAMLSAPLVDEASDELRLSPERRTFLNFWFRHVWEYVLPTFPTFFLTAAITGVPVADLCLVNLPLSIAALTAGVLFGFRGIKDPLYREPVTLAEGVQKIFLFFINLLPFFIVIFLTLYFNLHLAYAMAFVVAGMILVYHIPLSVLSRLAKTSLSLEIAFLILGIMVFKEVLLGSGAMGSMAQELAQMGMPPVVLVVLLPATIALITGYPPAFIGLSFPVLLPFIQSSNIGLYFVMLGVGSGLTAHLLSPMHACLVMTLEYYKASTDKVYRLLIAPAAVLFLTGAAVTILAYLFKG